MVEQDHGSRRAELFYQQLDGLQGLRQEARHDLLAESRKHAATNLLCQIPYIGPIRAGSAHCELHTVLRVETETLQALVSKVFCILTGEL